jgi:hypothetical protein
MTAAESNNSPSPSELIHSMIAGLADWRGQILSRIRELIYESAPEITEEWKWETAVWAQKGNVVAAAAFNDHVKLNFFKGALLPDPERLFNAGLDAKTTRAIDFYEGDDLRENALRDLVRAAVAQNLSGKK